MTGRKKVPAVDAGAKPLGVPANENHKPGRSGKAGWSAAPSAAQRGWLRRGLNEPGGKLPLFDSNGRRVNRRTVQTCVEAGWAEPWFANPLKPDWQVCKLTEKGRMAVGEKQSADRP